MAVSHLNSEVNEKSVSFKLGDNKTKLSLSFKYGQLNYILVELGLLDSIPFTRPEQLKDKFIGWHLFYYGNYSSNDYYDDFIIDFQEMKIQKDGTLSAYPELLSAVFYLLSRKVEFHSPVIQFINFSDSSCSRSKSFSITCWSNINLMVNKKNKIIVVYPKKISDTKITPENNRKFYEFLNHIYNKVPKLFGHKSVKSYIPTSNSNSNTSITVIEKLGGRYLLVNGEGEGEGEEGDDVNENTPLINTNNDLSHKH